jgi:hypothetical protein
MLLSSTINTFSLFLNFFINVYLVYKINCTKIVIFPYMYIMYLIKITPSITLSYPSPLLNNY